MQGKFSQKQVSISESRILSFQVYRSLRRERRLCVFQSRNRESYLFKCFKKSLVGLPAREFQSRNRESYLFKGGVQDFFRGENAGFNLGIENLIFSSKHGYYYKDRWLPFQSRNRESYLFKLQKWGDRWEKHQQFQSRNRESYLFKWCCPFERYYSNNPFQSRNRESYLFKKSVCSRSHVTVTVSIS